MIGIYKITNMINNKCYIGQSTNIKKRWNRHKNGPFNKKYKEYNCPLYRAIRKYGLENFNFEIIEECRKEDLEDKELFWIRLYNSNNKNFGYNQTIVTTYQTHYNKLNEDKLQNIFFLLLRSKMSLKQIAELNNVSIITVKDINQGHSWKSEFYEYPLRKTKCKIKFYYCCDCGKEISNNAKRCLICHNRYISKNKKINKINRDELKYLIRTESFVHIGKKFSVTDNAIKKWCDKFNLPRTKKEINAYSDEEWINI